MSDYILLYFTKKMIIFLSMCMKNKCTGNFTTRDNLMLIYFAHKLELIQIINKYIHKYIEKPSLYFGRQLFSIAPYIL